MEERLRYGLGGGLAERVAERLKIELEFQKAAKEPVFSKYQGMSIWGDEDEIIDEKPQITPKKEPEDEILFHRKPYPEELLDGQTDFEMKWPKATALTDRDEMFYKLVSFFRCGLMNFYF